MPKRTITCIAFLNSRVPRGQKNITFTALLSSRVLRAQDNHYIYSVFEFKSAPVPKTTNIFIAFLNLRVLQGQKKHYIYYVFELKSAPGTKGTLHLLGFWIQECSVSRRTIIFIACLSLRVLRGQKKHYI